MLTSLATISTTSPGRCSDRGRSCDQVHGGSAPSVGPQHVYMFTRSAFGETLLPAASVGIIVVASVGTRSRCSRRHFRTSRCPRSLHCQVPPSSDNVPLPQQTLLQEPSAAEALLQIKETKDAKVASPENGQPAAAAAAAAATAAAAGEEARLLAFEYSRYLQPARRPTSADWLHSLRGLPRSKMLRQIQNPLLSITGFSFVVTFAHCVLGMPGWPSLSGHTLLGAALSLLLVFRTNSAYQRFQEGRKIWNDILDLCRDIALSVALYRMDAGSRRIRLIRTSLQAFPFAMQRHVRSRDSNEIRDRLQALLDQLQQARYALNEKDVSGAEAGGSTINAHSPPKNRPLQIIQRLLKCIKSIKNREDVFTNRERVWLLGMVIQLSHTIGRCERLVQTPVPMSYARHTTRFVSIWTLTLPFALVGSLRWSTVPVVMIITWALFGILEIGHSIEDPFRESIELTPICEAIYHDCARALPPRSNAHAYD